MLIFYKAIPLNKDYNIKLLKQYLPFATISDYG